MASASSVQKVVSGKWDWHYLGIWAQNHWKKKLGLWKFFRTVTAASRGSAFCHKSWNFSVFSDLRGLPYNLHLPDATPACDKSQTLPGALRYKGRLLWRVNHEINMSWTGTEKCKFVVALIIIKIRAKITKCLLCDRHFGEPLAHPSIHLSVRPSTSPPPTHPFIICHLLIVL